MDTKPVLFGVGGLIVGGVVVGIGAATLNKPMEQSKSSHSHASSSSLEDKNGDEYDKAFLNTMIEHHEMAVEMAEQSATKAKHDELKQFSSELLTKGETEINTMKQWQAAWGYAATSHDH